MRKTVLTLITLMLAAMLLIGCVKVKAPEASVITADPTPEPTAAPTATSEPTPTPIPVYSVSGTVISVSSASFSLKMANGNTIQFPLTGSAATAIKEGSEVTVEYTGDILSTPQIQEITVTKEAPAATPAPESDLVAGTVTDVKDSSVSVKVSESATYTFRLSLATEYSFAGDPVVPPVAAGDSVQVKYSGTLQNSPSALEIEVLVASGNRSKTSSSSHSSSSDSDNQTNKKLTGIVTSLADSKVTIRTDNGRSWSFRIVSSTRVSGSYNLEVGSRIRVTYDGYASNSPKAKAINVIAPAGSNPSPSPSPKTKTVTGTITSFDGTMMRLSNGFGCYTGEATFIDGPVHPTDVVKITYYNDGVNVATRIKYLYTE